jgi:hypothetical protein
MKYGSVVGPLLASLRAGTGPEANRLVGQEIKTARGDVQTFVALDADQNLHLVISPAPQSDERFRRFRLKTFRIDVRNWVVAGRKAQNYIDVCCVASGQEAIVRPFVAFCDDLLVDLDAGVAAPEAVVFRAARRWHSFWAREAAAMSQQALRGLLGELLFLEHAVRAVGPKVVVAWAGPEGRDHDFQVGHDVAFEIKTSASIPYEIECNLNQLDRALFAGLFLVCYKVDRADDGLSVTDVAKTLAELLRADEQLLEAFHHKLELAGYDLRRESEYAGSRFVASAPEVFEVTDDFPGLTLRSFSRPPDMRVVDVRYVLEVSGVTPMTLDSPSLTPFLARLTAAES